LRAGTITETAGLSDAGFDDIMGRISYYSFVRRVSVLLGFTTLLLAGCYSGSRPPRIGSPAPDFTVQDADRKISLSDLHGKLVVLNFWATWCAPCVEEMPSLVQLQQRMKNKGVTVLAVSVDVDDSAYHKFLTDHKIDLLTARDPDQKSNRLYGTFRYPETYIIDRNGVVRRKFIGAVDWGLPEIVDFLSKL
jgi:cytochrome c biogenesis protein CcmG/thiol:disulfide interchange protein DsbE